MEYKKQGNKPWQKTPEAYFPYSASCNKFYCFPEPVEIATVYAVSALFPASFRIGRKLQPDIIALVVLTDGTYFRRFLSFIDIAAV